MTLQARLQQVELDLLQGPARHDERHLAAVLHDDFVEIGRSGRKWSKADVIDALLEEAGSADLVVDEWESTRLSSSLTLLTYRLGGDAEPQSRHSSLWDTSGPQPVLRFHQGTRVT
jgi:ribonuclease HI